MKIVLTILAFICVITAAAGCVCLIVGDIMKKHEFAKQSWYVFMAAMVTGAVLVVLLKKHTAPKAV